jgi:hypothetical protein
VPKPIWLTPLAPEQLHLVVGHAAQEIGGRLKSLLKAHARVENASCEGNRTSDIDKEI